MYRIRALLPDTLLNKNAQVPFNISLCPGQEKVQLWLFYLVQVLPDTCTMDFSKRSLQAAQGRWLIQPHAEHDFVSIDD
jgi:hypothetical protein